MIFFLFILLLKKKTFYLYYCYLILAEMLFSVRNMNVANYNLNISSGLLPYYLPISFAIEDIQKDKDIEEIEKYLTPDEILKIIDEQELNVSDINNPEIASRDEDEGLLY